MSKNTSPIHKPAIIIKKMPIILKKKQFVITSEKFHSIGQSVYQEDVIYESKIGDFLRGEERVTIVNKLNRLTNNSLTIAKCITPTNSIIEKTSERITNLIGQRNYDTVFSALCSVISQELKVRGILALLTGHKLKESSTQTPDHTHKTYRDSSSQTEESSINLFNKVRPKKRIKRQVLAPYVAKTVEKKIKKIIINPEDFKSDDLTDLNVKGLDLISENSNDSIGNLSSLSIKTTNSLLYNPHSIIDNVDKHTRQNPVTNKQDISATKEIQEVMSPAVGEILLGEATVTPNPGDKKRLALAHALMDWKTCMEADEDGNLPIHEAVKNNDVELLLRQCLALTARKRSVDEPANGDWTALKMAILKDLPNLTSILLRFGANPLLPDAEQKTSIHHAAEMPHAHLQAIEEHCMKKPRIILEQNDELWQDNYENIQDDRLARLLLGRMCSMCDQNGYTPLILASQLGMAENVETLVRIAPSTINKQMPTCGNTALYLSVGAACSDCIERGDKTVVAPNFRRTIETLVENGADPSISNHSGSNVNILLTEFNIAPLSTLVANKMTSINCFNGLMPDSKKSFDSYMLVKNKEGNINIMEMDKKNTQQKQNVIKQVDRSKPVIVENILLAPEQSGKRKATDREEFAKVFKNFVINVEERDKAVVKAGKAVVIKDLKIEMNSPKPIRQPAKKRIKIADKTK